MYLEKKNIKQLKEFKGRMTFVDKNKILAAENKTLNFRENMMEHGIDLKTANK